LLRTWSLLRSRQQLILPEEIDTLVSLVYEEQVELPIALQQWLDEAMVQGDGQDFAKRGQANQAIIGFPDDGSWNDTSRHIKADEDEPGLHPTLVAQTRLGDPSVVVIPLFAEDGYSPSAIPDFEQSKAWYLRAVSLSRKGIVKSLQTLGVPVGWKKSTLLRNCFALELDEQGRWQLDGLVRLDDDLGLVYETKEEA